MKRKLPIALIIALALVMTSFTSAHAKDGEGRKDKGMRKMDKTQVKERIELIKMWKLIEILDLDSETAVKLFPLMNEFDVKLQDLRNNRGETIKLMREELAKDAVDTAALGSLIAKFKQNERDMTEARIQRLDALSKVLTDEQIAKMIALAPMIEHRIKGLMSEAKARHKERKRWQRDSEDRPRDFERGRRFE
jgi:Spy/CpxP family protein refolding chaperone